MEKTAQDQREIAKSPARVSGWLIAFTIFVAVAIVAWLIWGGGTHAYLIAWGYAKNIWIGPVNPVTAPVL
jgi:uncharacterized membrane protein YjjP (DUF1212 family)